MFDFISLAVENLGTKGNFEKYGVNVTLSGFLIVFAMLILLVCLIAGFGMIMVKLTGKSKPANVDKPVKVEKPKKAPKPEKVSKPVVTEVFDDDGDVIAAISAAVMMMYEGTGVKPVIRSIRPAVSQRSAWKMAGIANNTRSF